MSHHQDVRIAELEAKLAQREDTYQVALDCLEFEAKENVALKAKLAEAESSGRDLEQKLVEGGYWMREGR